MKIYKAQLNNIGAASTPYITEHDFDHVSRAGGYVSGYTAQDITRSGGVTRCHSKPMDLSRYRTLGMHRNFSLWTHINGGNGNNGTALGNKGVTVAYQACYASSGATWYTAGVLRGSGTSISGSSGTYFANIASPLIAPFWRFEFSWAVSQVTSDLTVDYALMVE